MIARFRPAPTGGSSELARRRPRTPSTGAGGKRKAAVVAASTQPRADIDAAADEDHQGPEGQVPARPKAKFKFTSTEAGSTFQCKLDRKPFKPCRSPKKYKGLKPGKHVFKVRATDAAGNTDPSPAVKKFKVLG